MNIKISTRYSLFVIPLLVMTALVLSRSHQKSALVSPPLNSLPIKTSYVFPSNELGVIEASGLERISFGLNQFVGSNAVNCGWANPYTPKRYQIDACGIAAFRKKTPFRLMYNVSVHQGVENWGVGGNSKGELFFLANADGIDNTVVGETLHRCNHPMLIKVNGHLRFACRDKRNLLP